MSKVTKIKARFEGKIEPLKNSAPFFMVFIADSIYPPIRKYESYYDAFQEMLRLSKKENKKAFVMLSITQVEQIPNITQFKSIESE